APAGMRKLLEGVTLVGLPVRGEMQRVLPSRAGMESHGEDDDDGAAAWDETDGDDAMGAEAETKKLGLFEVERLIFMDNESARLVPEQLGLDVLSEGDARAVLERRVELGS
ncbi:hypothetical protein LTR02_018272, partial [Friedmanniomyces endolithicus]